MPPVNSAEKFVKTADVSDVSASKIRPVAQLHNSFIIAVDDEGMLLIDQHVAHERILFDKFRKQETERKIESQNLLLPETIDLTPAQSEAFSIIEADLESLGFGADAAVGQNGCDQKRADRSAAVGGQKSSRGNSRYGRSGKTRRRKSDSAR